MDRLKAYLVRWQESLGWLPVLAVMGILAMWFVGSLKPSVETDSIAWLLELPIVTAYAVAALALTFLSRRRFRRRLTDEEQATLWSQTVRGDRGPLIIFLADSLVWLVSLVALLSFFSQAVQR